MNPKLQRGIAILLLVIPGIMSTYGFLVMKDISYIWFAQIAEEYTGDTSSLVLGIQFVGGLLLFAAGIAFIGGWIFFRDRKRNYLSPRFRKRKQRSE